MKFSVTVTLKKDVLDPQGKVVQNTLLNMGMNNLKSLRQGKHFEIEVDESDHGLATKKIDTTHLKVESEGKFLGVLKRRQILGNYFQSTEKDDEIFIKKVNLYLKLNQNLNKTEIV